MSDIDCRVESKVEKNQTNEGKKEEPAVNKTAGTEKPVETPALENKTIETPVDFELTVVERGDGKIVFDVKTSGGSPVKFTFVNVSIGGKVFSIKTDANGQAVLYSTLVNMGGEAKVLTPSNRVKTVAFVELPSIAPANGGVCLINLIFFVIPCWLLPYLIALLILIIIIIIVIILISRKKEKKEKRGNKENDSKEKGKHENA